MKQIFLILLILLQAPLVSLENKYDSFLNFENSFFAQSSLKTFSPFTSTVLPPYQIQSSSSEDELVPGEPIPYSDDEFPQWLQDVRRGEVIFFGSLPISIILTNLTYSLIASSNSSMQPASDNYWTVIGISSGVSLAIMIADQIIIHHKRKQNSKRKYTMEE